MRRSERSERHFKVASLTLHVFVQIFDFLRLFWLVMLMWGNWCLAEGKPIPTELRNEEAELRHQIELEDDNTAGMVFNFCFYVWLPWKCNRDWGKIGSWNLCCLVAEKRGMKLCKCFWGVNFNGKLLFSVLLLRVNMGCWYVFD